MDSVTEEQAALIRHWTSYGQRGKTPDHRVSPYEWRHDPFSKPVTTPWHVPIQPDQLPLLILGFAPRKSSTSLADNAFSEGDTFTTHIFTSASRDPNMTPSEDKWFIYADGPDHNQEVRLHAHRSWSGIKAIELHIDAGFDGYGKDGKGAKITAITWESDPEKGAKDSDAKVYIEFAREVCSWVLNVTLGASTVSGDLDPGSGKGELPKTDTLMAAIQEIPFSQGPTYRWM
ncbi:hypothetical protein B0I37DRAFT_384037 [Chaetomium sp. MPI-CAGE-AT-0009]|nr:hypothetical protein B0I37DRAFT_384037 [Chaetomium sp. MPI-CAGE-AT-0009]